MTPKGQKNTNKLDTGNRIMEDFVRNDCMKMGGFPYTASDTSAEDRGY